VHSKSCGSGAMKSARSAKAKKTNVTHRMSDGSLMSGKKHKGKKIKSKKY